MPLVNITIYHMKELRSDDARCAILHEINKTKMAVVELPIKSSVEYMSDTHTPLTPHRASLRRQRGEDGWRTSNWQEHILTELISNTA